MTPLAAQKEESHGGTHQMTKDRSWGPEDRKENKTKIGCNANAHAPFLHNVLMFIRFKLPLASFITLRTVRKYLYF